MPPKSSPKTLLSMLSWSNRLEHRIFSATLCVGMIALLLAGPLAFAIEPPLLDEIISPVDANKAILIGETGPEYKIIVTGGPYEIAPGHADEDGHFEMTIALAQEALNTFSIKAQSPDGEESEAIEISIMESAEAAAEAEAAGEGDHTAPAAPTLEEAPETIDADTYTFTGKGEAESELRVSGSDSGKATIDEDGKFSIKLDLEQSVENNFAFVVVDEAGNISPSTKITLLEKSEAEVVQNENGDIEITFTNEDGETETITLTDVYGHWAEDYIVARIIDNDMKGYKDGTFLPEKQMNRAEFTKTILESLNYELEDVTSKPFTDVEEDDWYAPYALTAKKKDIIKGYSDGTFRPDAPIKRSEAVKILLEAAEIEVDDVEESPFSDVKKDDWFAPYVIKAYEMGLVKGYEDGRFGVEDAMTRGQVTKIVGELKKQL